MRFRDLCLSLFLVASLAGLCLAAAAQVKLEPAGALKDVAAPAEITKLLPPQGHKVVLGNGQALCEIWLATSLPPAPAQDADRTNYSGALGTGSWVGVVSFPNGARDFRGQAIKAGTYTLRYELMPNDGNHMGVAPQRDFLLLVPLADDTQPRTAMNEAALLKASRAAAGTSHPAVFMLLPAGEVANPPSLSPTGSKGVAGAAVYESPDGYVVFVGRTGNVPLALVVKGEAEQ